MNFNYLKGTMYPPQNQEISNLTHQRIKRDRQKHIVAQDYNVLFDNCSIIVYKNI